MAVERVDFVGEIVAHPPGFDEDPAAGVDYVVGGSPVFIEAGWMGDNLTNKLNAPATSTANGPFVGLGVKF